jgi:acetylglutamate kinase
VRKGELIGHFTDRDGIDGSQVAKLVEEAFGRPLKEGWWSDLDLADAYLSDSLRAGAIVTRIGDIHYLDKFAILEDARGEGLARTVWAQLVADHPVLYWRSRTENRFNSFYAEEADGSVKRGPWTVFWKGETDFTRIAPRVEAIAGLPPSFVGDDDE